MRLGQIRRVDVVPHAAPVESRIIVPIDHDLGSTAQRCLKDQRNEVSLVTTVFTKLAVGVGTEALKYRSKV